VSSHSGVKHTVEIKVSNTQVRVPKEKVDSLKGVVGGKTLARMKKECVECPFTMTTKSFIECFTCDNFVRRIKGQVHCSGQQV